MVDILIGLLNTDVLSSLSFIMNSSGIFVVEIFCVSSVVLCCGTVTFPKNLILFFFRYQIINTGDIAVKIGSAIQLTYDYYEYDHCYCTSSKNRGYYERNVWIRLFWTWYSYMQ